MSTKNKSIASQALLEMDAITSALKEESKNSINLLLTEAVKNALRENNEDDDDYEVQEDEDNKPSDKKEKSPKESGNPEMNGDDISGNDEMAQPQTAEPQNNGMEAGAENVPQQPQDGGNGEESWDEFSDYQVGDGNTYDLTGENDYDTVVKVYKLLNDEDQVIVQKDGDTLKLQDNNAGTEYLIDLGEDGDADVEAQPTAGPDDMGGEEMPNGINESLLDGIDIPEYNGDTFGDDIPFEDDEYDFMDDQNIIGHEIDDPFLDGDYEDYRKPELGDFDDFNYENEDENDMAGLYEGKIRRNKKTRKPMKESKEVLFEVDLGYTDNYQDKDPIAGLSNNEPSKGGKSWHKGIPTGTKKPWAGDSKSKGDPFKNTQKVQGSVNEEDINATDVLNAGTDELEETNLSQTRRDDTHSVHNRVPAANSDEHRRQGMQKTSKGTEYRPVTSESKELKAIKNENKELKKAIMELRKNLNEAYITNVNLGKITKLFLENTTSQAEKADIVNRFTNEAKTIEQSNTLYESIDKQLKKRQQINLNESSATANGTKELNEQKIYKTNDLMKTIDLMGRVLNC